MILERPAGVLIKTTCVDYPGRVAGSFFLKGCNLTCPYCYNINLVKDSGSDEELNTVSELFAHLEKRQGILSGLVISGGEPLLSPYTPLIIKKAKELGYKVKIDTNGTLPEKLEELMNDDILAPDFVAMDIKTSPYKYSSLMCNFGNEEFFTEKLAKSAALISKMESSQREWRTVLVPGLVEKADIKNMAAILPEDASWQFAQFRNGNCLNPAYNDLTPYTDSEITSLIEYAKSFISGAELR